MNIKTLLIIPLFTNICFSAEKEQEFVSKGPSALHPTLHRMHETEEAKLRRRLTDFWGAFEAAEKDIRSWVAAKREERQTTGRMGTILTRKLKAVYRSPEVEQWMRARFPKKKCEAWFTQEDSNVLFPEEARRHKASFDQEIGTLAEEMMEERRRVTTRFGEMGLALGDEEALQAARQKGDALLEEMIGQETDLEETDVIQRFQPLEGDDLAYMRFEMYQAGRRLKVLQARLAASNTGPLQAKIGEQSKELQKGRIGRMMRHKLRFYKEALLFVFKGDVAAFNNSKTGVDNLWRNLVKRGDEVKSVHIVHQGEDMGEGSGEAFYRFLNAYRAQYKEEREKLKELLTEIQAQRADMPRETDDFKQLANPVKAFDLDASFGDVEKAAVRRIHYIVGLEKQLFDATGGLTVTEVEERVELAKKAAHEYEQAFEAMQEAYDYYIHGPRPTLSITY